MSITLEKIDLIRSRANVSYEEAKIALEMSNYDEIEALIYLERNSKIASRSTDSKTPTGPSLWEQIKAFMSKVHAIKFVVEKESDTVINIPLTVFIISLLFLFPFVVTLIILGLIFGYKMTFIKSKTERYEVNAMFDSTLHKVRSHVDPSQGEKSTEVSKERL